MRRQLIAPITAMASGIVLAAVAWTPAVASVHCKVTDLETGKCLVKVQVPNGTRSDGPRDTGAGTACYWDGRQQGVTSPAPGPVPCTSESGYWSNHHNCYIKPLAPQPPATDQTWGGHRPGDGAIYDCYQPQTDLSHYFWSQNPPASSGVGPTPRQVAEIAIDQMNLRAVDIGITPKPGPDSVGIVGMPVWMWAANPDRHSVGPVTASASAGGITVSATARLHRVSWSMGDGTTVRCTGTGTPYKATYGNKKSPDCGHFYQRSSSGKPHGTYTVRATSDWIITWSGAGQNGTIRLDGLTRSTPITVGEAQVLVQ